MSVFGEGSHSDVKTTYYKAANVKTDRPNIAKNMGKDKEPEYVNWIAGILYKIERSEFVYEGKPVPKITYFLTNEDGSEVISFSCGWSATYQKDFLNRLANLESISAIKMLLWSSRDEKNNKDYTRGSIHNLSQDGEKGVVKMKYPASEEVIPKKKPIQVGKEIFYDDTDQDAFYEKLFKEQIIPRLKFNSLDEVSAFYEGTQRPDSKLNENATKNFKEKEVPVDSDGNEFDDDVPF